MQKGCIEHSMQAKRACLLANNFTLKYLVLGKLESYKKSKPNYLSLLLQFSANH